MPTVLTYVRPAYFALHSHAESRKLHHTFRCSAVLPTSPFDTGELLRLRLWLLRPLGLRRHLVLLRPCLVLLLLLPELQHLRLRLLAAAAAAALRLRLGRLLLDLLRDAELERPIARAKSPHNRGCAGWDKQLPYAEIEPQRHINGSRAVQERPYLKYLGPLLNYMGQHLNYL